jgi:hypothetical protein
VDGLLIRPGNRVVIGLEQQLDAVGRRGGDDRQPPGRAEREVALLDESEDVRVEGQGLFLIVDKTLVTAMVSMALPPLPRPDGLARLSVMAYISQG